MLTLDLYTREDLKREIDKIVRDLPHAENPRMDSGFSCLYYKEEPRDREHRRCIVGELAHRLGWTTPALNERGSATGVAKTYGWPISADVAAWLRNIQSKFDEDAGIHHSWEHTWARLQDAVWL